MPGWARGALWGGSAVTASWRRLRRLFIHSVLHADDTPHRIAIGLGLGVFIGITPTFGFQMVIAVALATALRINKAAALLAVWITNPITAIPIYALCHRLGNGLVVLMAGSPVSPSPSMGPLETGAPYASFEFSRLADLSFYQSVLNSVARVGIELWAGCLLAGFIASVITYFVARHLITAHRQRRESRRNKRQIIRPVNSFAKTTPKTGTIDAG